jgi:hypothetical protein
VRAADGRRYWCKTLNNFQSPRVPANEQIVGRLGALIGAPVCEVELIWIPDTLAGVEFRSGRTLEEGWASGSVAVEPAIETREMTARTRDDNARRHTGLYALHDWLGGSDAQWLTVGPDQRYFSHDHGHYFPGGPGWSEANLQASAGAPYPLAFPTPGLDPRERDRLADAIAAVSEDDVAGLLSVLPSSWPPDDDQLEALIDFILGRRAAVAHRVRALVTV